MGFFGPSAREKELTALTDFYWRVQKGNAFDVESVERYIRILTEATERPLAGPFTEVLKSILAEEAFSLSTPAFEKLDFKQQHDLTKLLRKWELKGQNGTELVQGILLGLFMELTKNLPKTAVPSPFTIPLAYAIPDTKEMISRIYKTLFDDKYTDKDIFTKLRTQMYLNLCFISDIQPYTETKKRFKHAYDSDLPLPKIVSTYLAKTPLVELFQTLVPLKLTHEDRFSHMHVLGGTGAGKSSLIETLIRHDLSSDDPPSIVLIDPHSDTLRKLAHSDLGIEDRIIILDPRDLKHPFALNPFAINRERLASYDETTREQVTAGVIQTFDYLFSSLFDMDLTGKQAVYFRYITRMLMMLPEVENRNATILDMLKFIDDPTPYLKTIEALPEIQRDFFNRDLLAKGNNTFKQTQEQVRYRLQAIIENPTLARMFTSTESTVDFYTEMNRGAVILIDTAEDFLKDGSPLFGKFIVALLLQAISERAAIEAKDRKPTFIFIDEAADLFSTNIDSLLNDARKFKVGMVLAHQFLDQATPRLKASLASNTAIKFASGLSAGDARAIASDMRTTPDFILGQPKLQFATHIKNVTPQAISIPIQYVTGHRTLSEGSYDELIARNRKKVSLGPAKATRAEPPKGSRETPHTDSAQGPDEDISEKWD